MKHATRLILRVVTAGYAAVLVVATYIPRLDVSIGVATAVPPDKVLHLAAYGLRGAWIPGGLLAADVELGWCGRLPLAPTGIAAFALVDEIAQSMFGRDAEPFDCAADVVGAFAGLCVAAGLVAVVRSSGRDRRQQMKRPLS